MRHFLALCLLLGAACATQEQCANPYDTGVRDGMLNANQAGPLAAQCSGFNEARYREGFAEGFSRRGRVWAL
jgi:hypothetical protein